jgi:hypothetical protein
MRNGLYSAGSEQVPLASFYEHGTEFVEALSNYKHLSKNFCPSELCAVLEPVQLLESTTNNTDRKRTSTLKMVSKAMYPSISLFSQRENHLPWN